MHHRHYNLPPPKVGRPLHRQCDLLSHYPAVPGWKGLRKLPVTIITHSITVPNSWTMPFCIRWMTIAFLILLCSHWPFYTQECSNYCMFIGQFYSTKGYGLELCPLPLIIKALKCKPSTQYTHVVSLQCSILWRILHRHRACQFTVAGSEANGCCL